MNSALQTYKIPDVPEFCEPYDAGDGAAWLLSIINNVSEESAKGARIHQRAIDKDVLAAIFVIQEIQLNEALQLEWCKLPQWEGKKKRPKAGVTDNILEEVFRFIWVFLQNDQDAFELRFNAVKHFVGKGCTLEQSVEKIREAGGYVAVRNVVRSERGRSQSKSAAVAEDASRSEKLEREKPSKSAWLTLNTALDGNDITPDPSDASKEPGWRELKTNQHVYDLNDDHLVLCEIEPELRTELFGLDFREKSDPVRILALGETGTDGFKRLKIVFNIELFGGSPDDNNAFFFYDGAMSVLQPLIDSGVLVVKSGQTGMDQVGTLRWDGATAQARMDNILSAQYSDGTRVDAVLAPNDGVARGILSSLKGIGYGSGDLPYPIISGQDAEVPSIKAIIAGEQYSTVYKDTRELARVTADLIDAALSGNEPTDLDTTTYDNGVKVVPSLLLTPYEVDATNYKELVVDSGYINEADLQ